MYIKNQLHCFEVKRVPITQKIEWSVPNSVRSGVVKFSTVGVPSFAVVALGKHAKTPQSMQRISKFHWWRRMHMKKWIDCDRFHDDWVHKWGPTTMTGFSKAEERVQHHAEKNAGILGNWWDLNISNAPLKGSFGREHKQWRSTVGKAPKPSAISSIDLFMFCSKRWTYFLFFKKGYHPSTCISISLSGSWTQLSRRDWAIILAYDRRVY